MKPALFKLRSAIISMTPAFLVPFLKSAEKSIKGILPSYVKFTCNICGAQNLQKKDRLGRDNITCTECTSGVRTRTIINILSYHFFKKGKLLPEFPVEKSITGIGVSDWVGYAKSLEKKFSYVNTQYHSEPKLDILNIPQSMKEQFDFVICSDVLEHVFQPVSKAFDNLFSLLKPGGTVIISVPYGLGPSTVEHYPSLFDFKILEDAHGYYLENKTKDGKLERFDNLVFHGGPGSTLELRVFCEADILQLLKNSGFSEIKIHHESDLKFGIYWPSPFSLPISAKKGLLKRFNGPA